MRPKVPERGKSEIGMIMKQIISMAPFIGEAQGRRYKHGSQRDCLI